MLHFPGENIHVSTKYWLIWNVIIFIRNTPKGKTVEIKIQENVGLQM